MDVEDIDIPRLRLSAPQQEELLKTIFRLQRSGISLKDIAVFFMESDRTQQFGEALNDLVESGHKTPLAACLSRSLSKESLACISAGEESGNLVNGLEQAIYVVSVTRRVLTSAGPLARSALIYLVLGVLAGAVFALYVIPQFKNSLPPMPPKGGAWPPGVSALFNFSDVAGQFGAPFALLLVSISILYGYLAIRGRGAWRDRIGFDNWFLVRQWMMYQLAVFSINLGGMWNSGVKLDIAVQKIMDTAPPAVQRHLERILEGLGEGLQQKAFDTGWFDSMTYMMLSGAYASGNTGEGLVDIGNTLCERVVAQLTFAAGAFKVVLQMYVLGLAVFMYWGMSQIGQAMY